MVQKHGRMFRNDELNNAAKLGIFQDLFGSDVLRFRASSEFDGALSCGQSLVITNKGWKYRYDLAFDDTDLSWIAFSVKSVHPDEEIVSSNEHDKEFRDQSTKHWCLELKEQEMELAEFFLINSPLEREYVSLVARTILDKVAQKPDFLGEVQSGILAPALFQPYTFSRDLLGQAMESVIKAALGLGDYVVPSTGVVVRNWKPKLTSLDDIVYIRMSKLSDDPSVRALAHIDKGIKESGLEGVSWDFILSEPCTGEAVLLGPSEEKFVVLMEDDTVTELGSNLIVNNSILEEGKLNDGRFHSFNLMHFSWIVNIKEGYGYWIPASHIKQEWAVSMEPKLEIPSSQLKEFRVDLKGDLNGNWFKYIWEKIISVYPDPDHDRLDQLQGNEEENAPQRLAYERLAAPNSRYQDFLQNCAFTGEGITSTVYLGNHVSSFFFFRWTLADKERKEFQELGYRLVGADSTSSSGGIWILLYHTYSEECPLAPTVRAQDPQTLYRPYFPLCDIGPPNVINLPRPCYSIPSKDMFTPEKPQEVELFDVYHPSKQPAASYTLSSSNDLHQTLMSFMTQYSPDQLVPINGPPAALLDCLLKMKPVGGD